MTKPQIEQLVSSLELDNYNAFGMNALIPGMQKLVDIMQAVVDEFRIKAAAAFALQHGLENSALEAVKVKGPRRPGRPVGTSARSGWPDDPEERKREMRRRQAVARAKTGVLAQSAAGAKTWKRKTKKEREEWKRKMQAGRKKQARAKAAATAPVVSLEKAS